MKPRRVLVMAAVAVLGSIAAILLALSFFGPPVFVSTIGSETLSPSYRKGETVRVRVWPRFPYLPRRGEVVILVAPAGAGDRAGEYFIKRVIGLPGESVAVVSGRAVIDGRILDEPWINLRAGPGPDAPPQLMREDEYFLLGDARGISFDSRRWGPGTLVDFIGPVEEQRRRGSSSAN